MNRSLPFAAVVLVALAAAAGCSSAPVEPTSNIALTKETIVADQGIVDTAIVQDGNITFSAAGHDAIVAKLHVGSVFAGNASDISKTNVIGFVRKVTAIAKDGTNIVLTTDEGQLDDLIETGSFSIQANHIDFGAGKPSVGTKGAGLGVRGYALPDDIDSYKFKYVIDHKVLASFKETKTFKGGQADVAGALELVGAHFAFDPSVDYNFNKDGLDSSISVEVGGRLNAGIGLKASVAASAQVKIDEDYVKDFGAIAADNADIYTSPPASLGTVNLPLGLKLHPSATLKLSLVCEHIVAYGAAEIEAGAMASASAKFFGKVSRKGIKTDFTKDFNFTPYWDYKADAELSAKCAVVGKITVTATLRSKLVDLDADASVTVNAGIDGDASLRAAKGQATQKCGKFSGYVKADAHIGANIKVVFVPRIQKDNDIPLCDLKFAGEGGTCAGLEGGDDSCEGRADGTYCSNISPYVASGCKDGVRDTVRYCDDVTQQCSGGAGNAGTPEGDFAIKCE